MLPAFQFEPLLLRALTDLFMRGVADRFYCRDIWSVCDEFEPNPFGAPIFELGVILVRCLKVFEVI